MVALRSSHTRSTNYYEQALRLALARQIPQVKTFFSSGCIIDGVLDFGALAPIDVQLSAPMTEDFGPMFDYGRQIGNRFRELPEVSQIMTKQLADYPTMEVDIDRTKAARLGVSERSMITNLITAINSNDMIKPSIRIDPRNGDDYFSAQNLQAYRTSCIVPGESPPDFKTDS
jgi:multidrug efflux pump subunit AcrB